MVPVGMVAECVAIKSGLTEIVQAVEILRCELVVSELVVSELIVAKLIVGGERVAISHCVVVTEIMRSVTSNCCMCVRPAVGARCTATPPMTHVGQGTMVATASAMPAATSAVKRGKPTPAVTATATASTSASVATPGDCRSVRDDAKGANRSAGRQNTYRSLLHGTSPLELKPLARRRVRQPHESRLIQNLATAAE